MTQKINDILREADHYLAKPRNSKTLERYVRIWNAIQTSGIDVLDYVSHVAVAKPGQYVLTRCAAICGLWDNIRRRIHTAIRNIKAGLRNPALTDIETVLTLREKIDLLRERIPPEGAFTRRGQSKRSSLKGLPSDWRERLVGHTIAPALPAVLVTLLSGCRPEELAMGVRVDVLDAHHLTIVINGAKTTETNGQPWRKLTFGTNGSPLPTLLWELTAQKSGTLIVKRQPRTLHKNLAEAGERAGLRSISAYTARHYLASQLKHHWAGAKEAIAMVLGHASTGTQKRYGSRQQGRKGGTALVSVEAARPVRALNRSHPKRESIAAVALDTKKTESGGTWEAPEPAP